jgi:hypothetical protein
VVDQVRQVADPSSDDGNSQSLSFDHHDAIRLIARRHDGERRMLHQPQNLRVGDRAEKLDSRAQPEFARKLLQVAPFLPIAGEPERRGDTRPERCPSADEEIESLLSHHAPGGKRI